MKTYSPADLERQRLAHLRADGYGRHRHLYLHEAMRRLAAAVASRKPGAALTMLDYGCGKGGFIEEVRNLDLFAEITGFDPAVRQFQARPSGRFDVVTCLDVLDVVQPRFMDALLEDIAGLTLDTAVFDCLTRPRQDSPLKPHPPFYWRQLVHRGMETVETRVEFAGMDGFERVIIEATPR